MKHEKLAESLNQIRDDYIQEAATPRKHRPYWFGALAAVLALVLVCGAVWQPLSNRADNTNEAGLHQVADAEQENPAENLYGLIPYAIAAPVYPQLSAYPIDYDGDAYSAWWDDQRELHDQPPGYADSLSGYFSAAVPALLTESTGRNTVCSPVNLYMALAMLAETTAGDSRGQILELLGADSIEALRTQAGHVWQAHYNDDGLTTSILANSLWLDDAYTYNRKTVQLLADSYYASVFQGDLGSESMNSALQAWLDQQTKGLLKEQVQNVELSPFSSLVLASTVCYQVQWQSRFNKDLNTQAIFHSPSGDREVTYLHETLAYGPYYWSENFGAVSLPLEDDGQMWLLLPDEGVSPEELLTSGEAMDFLLAEDHTDKKSPIVHLSLPKFDVASDMEVSQQLQKLGVTDIFDSSNADFSPIIPVEDGGAVSNITHAARVGIDEEGVVAAAFTVILRAGAGMPPEEEMDFVLDRPFLFCIESRDGLPLFMGIVNEP